ncbi:MAG: DNA gyrase inhibitor YacG [Bradyrhizobiaceae bacterium]|nr:DNA gyrase inhibitor YacG [Bradyrhizobiaceae bacterium]
MPERKEESGRKAGGTGRICPTCGRPSVQAFRPFCSARCRDVDLHRWLSGQYAIPVAEDEDEDGALPEIGSPGVGSGEEKP